MGPRQPRAARARPAAVDGALSLTASASVALPLLIIGNLDNRRVTGFVEAMDAGGLPRPRLLAHRDLVAQPERLAELPDTPMWVRLDTCGEDPQLERELLGLGHEVITAAAGQDGQDQPAWEIGRCEHLDPDALARTPLRHGQILAPRQHHLGYLRYLSRLQAVFAARPQWRVLNPVADLRVLFDKRLSSRRYAGLGIPVPEPLLEPGDPPIETPAELRAAMEARRWPAVFVKLSSASSASCLALYRYLPMRPPDQRELLLTTVAPTPNGRFNSLRLTQLREREPIDALLGWLLREGVQIEQAISKPRIDGRSFDLRVLVIAGQAAFVVVRESRHPITNLHLGGRRGDLDRLRARVGPEAWAAAMASCEAVFAAHGCLHVGVDLCFERDLVGHRVIEANAFGDLLPGLTRDGKSVYEWELGAIAKLEA